MEQIVKKTTQKNFDVSLVQNPGVYFEGSS